MNILTKIINKFKAKKVVSEEQSLVSLDSKIIYLPDYQTQLYISKMFKTLDAKINMESKVLEKYKEQKKYLLSNMFI